jgi:phosphoribosyl-ATP pyrophosphohydrolase/phosphoribosyl-AMP cyclohydrolase
LNEFLETEPIDHEKSFVVGDRESDVELAKNIGVHAYRMETNGQFPYTTSAHYLKSLTNKVDWNKVNGFVPTIIQDVSSGIVLMLGYMDKAALTKTEDTGFVWFFSRTKKRLWKKGEVSGNVLRVQSMELDCDNDTLLVSVIPAGPTCHTGDVSCFKELRSHNEIATLFSTITERKRDLPRGSYTTSLFNAGLDRIALKVAEESMEIIHAATKQTEQRLIEETVDLFYHLFVLLAAKSIDFSSIEAEMRKRYKVTYTNHP